MSTNRTTFYELGKSASKTNQFQGEDFLDRALVAVGVTEPDRARWIQRYQQLDTVRQAPQIHTSNRLRTALVFAACVLLTATLSAAITFWLSRSDPVPTPSHLDAVVVEVQNKVALGADDLREDLTPAYLSSRPERRCAAPERHCKITGTDMTSGVLLVAICRRDGDELVNYNIDSGATDNPNRAKSNLWYRIQMPNGVTGYLSDPIPRVVG